MRLKPDLAEAYFSMGHVYTNLGQLRKAAEAYRTTVRYRRDYVAAYNNLGLTLRRLRRLRDAIEPLKQAIAYNSKFAPAYFNLALVYHALGDREAAQQQLDTLRTLDPERANRVASIMANRRGNR